MKKIKAAETLFKIKEHNKLKNWQTNESGETMKIKIKTFFNLLIVLCIGFSSHILIKIKHILSTCGPTYHIVN